MSIAIGLGAVALAIWLGLVFGRGFFWWPRLPALAPEPARWPRVAAVMPARDEAELVGKAVGSLLCQDYPGDFRVILVDDHSSDGTAEVARRSADQVVGGARFDIVKAPMLPPGWTGKLAAMNCGVEATGDAELLLFTDADIAHHPRHLRALVARLEAEGCDLVSEMVLLNCASLAERFLIPAFVFFFAMLYPFPWVGALRRRTAAAAGGTMLLRRSALVRIGGLAAIKGNLIDDCALARAVKRSGGAIRLDLTRAALSLRRYESFASIWNMIARSAYTQLRYSPWLLVGTLLGMALTYLAPPLLLLSADGVAEWMGLAAWLLMGLAYLPMVRFYGLMPVWGLLLPATAAVYLAATVASAWRHWRGRGGAWKGRVAWRSAR
ncbi:MAG: glycosyltransferase [Stellaceae bacterium]